MWEFTNLPMPIERMTVWEWLAFANLPMNQFANVPMFILKLVGAKCFSPNAHHWTYACYGIHGHANWDMNAEGPKFHSPRFQPWGR
jgi:hypothetical protein